MKNEILIRDNGFYAVYEQTVWKLTGLAESVLNFTIEYGAVSKTIRALVVGGVAKCYLRDALKELSELRKQTLPLSEESVYSFETVTVSASPGGVPTSIEINVIDSILSPYTFINQKQFLTLQKSVEADSRFEQGVYYYGEREITRETATVTDDRIFGDAESVNYLSFRNQGILSKMGTLMPYVLDISGDGLVVISGFASGSLATVSLAHSTIVGAGACAFGSVVGDTITVEGGLFSGMILRNASDVVLFEIEFSTKYVLEGKAVGYCYLNRILLFATSQTWIESDAVLTHQKQYLEHGGVVAKAGGNFLAYLANNWDTTNEYLDLDNFESISNPTGKVGLWRTKTLTDGLVSLVKNDWPVAPIPISISILSGNTRAAMSVYDANWTNARNSTSSSVSFVNLYHNASKANLTTYGITRLVFDIDTLGGQILESGTITLAKTTSAIDSPSAYLYGLTRTTPGTTDAADFDNGGATKLSDLAVYDGVSESITFTLNAAGLAYVNGGSVSFMVRAEMDADNVTPTDIINSFQVFSTFTTSFFKAGLNIDLVQATASKQPQLGYDRVSSYTAEASKLSLTGTLVNTWNNRDATARAFTSLTGSGATRPTRNSGTGAVEFTQADVMSNTAVYSLTCNALTVSLKLKASTLSANASYQDFYVRVGLSSANYFWVGVQVGGGSSTVTVFGSLFVLGTGFAAVTKNYTFAQINAILNSESVLQYVFKNGKASLYLNNVLLSETVFTGVFTNPTIAARCAVTSSFIGATISVYSFSNYFTPLTVSELNLLYVQRNNYDYTLQKKTLVSTANAILSTNILANQTVNELSVCFNVYIQSTRSSTGENTYIGSDSYVAVPNKGFTVNVTVSGANWYFRCKFGDGTTGWGCASNTNLSRAQFEALYKDRWVNIIATFANGVSKLYINGVLDGSNTGVAGSIIMPTDGKISVMGRGSLGEMLVGNKIDKIALLSRALTDEEITNLQMTFFPKAQSGVYPYNWIEGSGDIEINNVGNDEIYTFPQIENLASSIVYADAPTNHNIEQFELNGQTYDMFTQNESAMGELDAVQIVGGGRVGLSRPCGKLTTSMLKFKNRFGVYEYIPFTANSEYNNSRVESEEGEFESGYYVFGKRTERKIKLFNPFFPSESVEAVTDLQKGANAFYSDGWQFSQYNSVLSEVVEPDMVLETNQRLLRYNMDPREEISRLKVGDRVTFELVAVPFTMSEIWGTITGIESNGAITIFFDETDENTGLVLIDSWVASFALLRICMYDAWELCRIESVNSIRRVGGSVSPIEVEIILNPDDYFDL